MTFDKWLKDAREAAGMTREELAREVYGHNLDYVIANYEESQVYGGLRAREVSAIAEVLNADPDEAFYAAGQIPPDLQQRVFAGGPALWRVLREEFVGKDGARRCHKTLDLETDEVTEEAR